MVVEKKKAASAPKKPKTEKKPAQETAPVAQAAVAKTTEVDARNALQKRRTLEGIVVSDKMQKTIVVKVDRRVRDEMYKKYTVRSRRFKAHDEKNEAKTGDLVLIVESKPMSKEKRWCLASIIRRGGQAPEVNV